jgi:hypothetical protein
VLGFYFSDHPLTPYRPYIEARATTEISRLREARDLAEVSLVCLVQARKAHTDRNGRRWRSSRSRISKEPSRPRCSPTSSRSIAPISSRAPCSKCAGGSTSGGRGAEDGAHRGQASRAAPSGAAVHIDLARGGEKVALEEIRSLLVRHPGISPVYFTVRGETDPGPTQIRAKRLLVSPSEELLNALRERLGAEAVRVVERADEVAVSPMSGAA